MTSHRLKFAIFGNVFQPKKSASITRLLTCLSQNGAEVSMDSAFYDFIQRSGCSAQGVARVFDDGDFDADFVISMGGDGTFLKAAARVGTKAGLPCRRNPLRHRSLHKGAAHGRVYH